MRFLAGPLAGLVLFGALAAAPALAQDPADRAGLPPARFTAGVAAAVAQPVGEFSDYVSVGGGLQGFLRVRLDDAGLLSLRLQGGALLYGSETRRVCLSQTVGCRIQVDLTTSNSIAMLGLGPELGLPLGPVRLYGAGTVGFDYFTTDSQVSGTSGSEPFASTNNFSDGGFSWSAGGGVEVMVARARRVDVSVDLGASYQRNGRREYLTEGDIRDRPDGSLEFDVRRSEANLVLWRLGVSLGIWPEG